MDAILVQDWGVLATLQKNYSRRAAARLDADEPAHALGRSGSGKARHDTRGARARAFARGDRRNLPKKPHRDRNVRPRRAVHVLQRPVRDVCRHRAAQRQPWRLRPALPSALRLFRQGGRPSAELEGREPRALRAGDDGYGRCLPQDRRAHEAAGICRRRDGNLRAPSARASHADEGRAEKLTLAFSRDGFTEGYYRGARGREMFGTRPENARWPEDWFNEIRTRYEKENLRLVPLALNCTIRAGQPMHLTAEDADGHRVTVTGAVPEAARSRAVTAEEVETRLRKTGGTAFSAAQCAVALDGGLAVSAGALNALRREALAQMEAQRTAVPKRRVFDFVPPTIVKNSADKPLLTVSLHRAEQLSEELIALAPARGDGICACRAAAPARPFTTSRQNRIFRGAAARVADGRTSLFCARCSRTPPKKASRACRSPTSAISRSCADLICKLHGGWPLNLYNSARSLSGKNRDFRARALVRAARRADS